MGRRSVVTNSERRIDIPSAHPVRCVEFSSCLDFAQKKALAKSRPIRLCKCLIVFDLCLHIDVGFCQMGKIVIGRMLLIQGSLQ